MIDTSNSFHDMLLNYSPLTVLGQYNRSTSHVIRWHVASFSLPYSKHRIVERELLYDVIHMQATYAFTIRSR